MKKAITLFLFLFYMLNIQFVNAQKDVPIGVWRTHLSYQNAQSMAVAGNKIYCATGTGLFFFDKEENSANILSKLDGFSDLEISALAYEEELGTLVIAYKNGNIDLLRDNEINEIINLSTIKDSPLAGSKVIHHILFQDTTAYLSADFGVLVLDMKKPEIKEIYTNLGSMGEKISIHSSAIADNHIYLATEQGVISAPLNENLNLKDFHNWNRFDLEDGIPQSAIQVISTFKGSVYAGLDNVALYRYNGTTWEATDLSVQSVFRSLQGTPDKLLVSLSNQIIQYIDNQNIIEISDGLVKDPYIANFDTDGIIWIADGTNGLVSNLEGVYKSYIPSGPFSNDVWDLYYSNNKIIGLPGGYDQNFSPLNNNRGFYVYEGGLWQNFNTQNGNMPAAKDLLGAVYDPLSRKTYFASFGYGMMVWDETGLTVIDEQTEDSPLENTNPPGRFVQISGVASDANGGVWVSNYGASQPLHVLRAGNVWESFSLSGLTTQHPLNMAITLSGDKWIRLGTDDEEGGGILVFNEEGNRQRLLTSALQAGGLPDNHVTDLALDKEGYMWVTTSKGVCYFVNTLSVLDGQPISAVKPVFGTNFLFRDELVTCIKVDGGNRKWMGTKNGVWLFNETADELISHFTTENSPLLSNNILAIEIHERSGEVFFATDKGIISFRGTATSQEYQPQEIKIFPNPVRENFEGLVGITGLAQNAVIKITDISGKLVREIQAEGSTAVWDVADYRGERAKSGIYLVFTAIPDSNKALVGKIAVID